ncbi:hypothetical protein RQP46_004996 [Phenoliferia psychrophenolica]
MSLLGPVRAALRRPTPFGRVPIGVIPQCTPFLLSRPSAFPSPSSFSAPPTSPLRALLHTSSRAQAKAPAPTIPFLELPLQTQKRLRAFATAHPNDPEAQADLFAQLLRWPGTEATQEVIGRYEELTGLWNGVEGLDGGSKANETDPAVAKAILADDELARLYLQALASAAHSSGAARFQGASAPTDALGLALAKIAAAPLRRSQLLGLASPASSTQTDASAHSTTASPTLGTASLASASAPSTPSPPAPTATAATSSPTPQQSLSPSALVTALFSGSASRGRGGEARILSGGSSLWGSGAAAKAGSGAEPIRVIVEEAKSPWWQRAGKFVLVTALYSFLLLSLLSLLLDSSGILRATQSATPFAPSPVQDGSDPSGRGTTFKDVHGCEEAKNELFEIVEFLKNPSVFERLGGRIPRGVLLTGPPGTGKTLLARAVAGEAGVAFFPVSGSEFDEMYVGVGAKRIRELFKAARKAAPAIIFIDELDAIGGKRSPRDQHYVKQTLNQLLVELDGFTPGEGVILIGATNFPESLDNALVRPGRFDRHVVVPLPDVRGRMQILKHHMRNVGYDKTIDVTLLARGTIGFSGADLQALVNQAAVKASTENAASVRESHFLWAKERIMMGAARKSAFVTEADKLATAYHEGGHALVALHTPGAYPLESVTVVPRGNALGYTLMVPQMDKTSHTLAEYRAKLDVAMGGRVAESLIYGADQVTDGASSDISNATSMAGMMVRRFGFSDRLGPVAHVESADSPTSPATQAIIESEIRTLIEDAQARATKLLTDKKHELDRLAKALVEHETLSLKEIEMVIRGEKITKTLID